MQVRTEAQVVIKESRERVFDFATAVDVMPKVFKGSGPVPGIEKVENTNGDETREGTIRSISNTDGSVLEEHMLLFRRPEEQKYQIVSGLKPPFSMLVKTGGGHWIFTEEAGETRIVWRFYFELTSPILYPLGQMMVGVFFKRAMQNCLDSIKAQVESKT